MRQARHLLVLLGLILGAGGCASDGLIGNAFQPDVYIVRPGDTVYSIAWRYQVDPDDLVRWNRLEDPDRLRVGQRLRLTPPAAGTVARTPGGNERSGAPEATSPGSGAAGGRAKAARDGRAAQVERRAGTWRWPTEGEVIGTFDDGLVSGRGVDIAGRVGQSVQATAAGQVVYSGEGLQAYGRLVIIRHAGEYLSAYAHNSQLLVREGQRVTAGQQIARMGESDDGRAVLHFEIRREGKPVDPLEYLPPRD